MKTQTAPTKSISSMRAHLTHLWNDVLPTAAQSNDPVQPNWPVINNQCFIRIILDNALETTDAPALKNMTGSQLERAVDLAERIATGEEDLMQLEEKSLAMRGQKTTTMTKRKASSSEDDLSSSLNTEAPKKRKVAGAPPTISSYFLPSPDTTPAAANTAKITSTSKPKSTDKKDQSSNPHPKIDPETHYQPLTTSLNLIRASSLTPFRKTMLSLLCQVPPGRWSTYSALANHHNKVSPDKKTCARAVGGAMRNNPFAPGVPCHRVLAADRSLGGFCGYWGEDGRFASKKHELLYGEGVRFDGKGKVLGEPFTGFK